MNSGQFKKGMRPEENHAYTHGHARRGGRTPEYRAWIKMRERCMNPNDERYVHYGARGITVCEKWLNDFAAFFDDMGPKPGSNYSIDRIDNDGNYDPKNCRWADQTTQVRNRRNSRKIEFGGRVLCVAEWGEAIGVPYKTLHARLANGWTVERALTTPLSVKRSESARRRNCTGST